MCVIFTLTISYFLLLFANQAMADTYTVTRVFDGDTVEIKTKQAKFKLRLADIDAPERNQAYGKKSRRALTQLCKERTVVIHVNLLGLDKYKRHLGHLQCNKIDAGTYLTAQGLAWHNAKYSHNPLTQEAERNARRNKLGLWKTNNPMPPWVWREKHPLH
ncbi:MAG: thermonuclease family protein [Methylotenera sp.]|nr:thermonuclease family protein [Methylotenera sp.]